MGKARAQGRRRDLDTVGRVGAASKHGNFARMIIGLPRLPFTRVQVILAVFVDLIGRDNVSGAVGQSVDRDPFAITAKTASREVRELPPRVRVVRIGLPLVNAVRLVRVIDEPERIVHGYGFGGGTFVENPGRIGPWHAPNGDLYFIMEPAETDNVFMVIKSTDNGRTWREVDAANRPETNDLESVDTRQVGDTIHILHQVTSSSRYHAFRTSDHPTHPDTWAVRDEVAGRAEAIAQTAAFEVRSDGSMVAFYLGQAKIHYSVRSVAGAWSDVRTVDPDIAPNQAGPQAVLGANDTIHLAYYGTDGTIWYRRFLPDGSFTPREQIATGAGTSRAEYGAVLPLVYVPESDTVVIIYRLGSGNLWERRVVSGRRPTPAVQVTDRIVTTDAVDSQQPGADAVRDGNTVHLLFIEESSRSIFSTHDQGGWQPPELQVGNITGCWLRGSIYTRRDGVRVYGYIYDAGSDGGAGMNRFGEVVLSRQ